MRKFLLFIIALTVSLNADNMYTQPMYAQQMQQQIPQQQYIQQPVYQGMPQYQQQPMQQAMPMQMQQPMQQQMMPQQQPMPMQNQSMPQQQVNGQIMQKGPEAKEMQQQPNVIVKKQEAPRYIPLYITHSNNPTGNLNSMLIFLADQLERNVDSKYFSQPTIVTTFANLDNLKNTSSFGRLLSENLTHELQVRKWRVVEIRMAKSIIMNEKGEFSMTRETNKIKGAHQVRAIVTGTYSFTDECVIVNAKVLNVDTGIILSSGQISIPLDSLNGMMYDDINPRVMRIKGE